MCVNYLQIGFVVYPETDIEIFRMDRESKSVKISFHVSGRKIGTIRLVFGRSGAVSGALSGFERSWPYRY